MHVDTRQLENNSIIEGDICIVGAGAAGISMALDLKDSKQKVILLEGGGFHHDDQIQALYNGKTTGQKYYPLQSSRLHLFGGTTGHWGGFCSPFDEIDFLKRDWVPYSGWPITKADLRPYYIQANKIIHLGPFEYDLEYWQNKLPNFIPLPLDDKVFWNKIWQINPLRFATTYQQSIISADNLHLYTYANVVDLIQNEDLTNISRLITRDHSGKTHTFKAKIFVLACGAIQNARLLLASNSQSPTGIGNGQDLVGRFFMEHLEINSAELWLFKSLSTDLYLNRTRSPKIQAELAVAPQIQTKEKILNGTFSLRPLESGSSIQRMELWQDPDPRESQTKLSQYLKNRKFRETPRSAFQLQIRIEQTPNPNSRVTIGPDKDALGVPQANLHWQLSDLDKYSVRRMHELLAQQLGINDLGRLKFADFLLDPMDSTFPSTTNGGWHHMGTTRMSDDPKTGVVDANCQVHGIDNLFIAGSGCFTTAAAPNPTLTLIALSLRLSQFIKTLLKFKL